MTKFIYIFIAIAIILLFKNIHCSPVQDNGIININSLAPSLPYHETISPKFFLNNIFELFNDIVRDAIFKINNVLASISYPFNDSSVTLKLIEDNAKNQLNDIVEYVRNIFAESQFQENINCTLEFYGEMENIIGNGNETILKCISNSTKECDTIRTMIENYTIQVNEIVSYASTVVNNCIQINNFFQQMSCIITNANDIAQQIDDVIPKISEALLNTIVDLNRTINNTNYCVSDVIEIVRNEINGIIQAIKFCTNGTRTI